MLKQTADSLNPTGVADAALAASRQMWLAGLGAAMVTRDWARNDAGHVFRALVKEGSAVETRAIRIIDQGVESTIAIATTAWNKARHTALTTVNELVDTAAAALPKFRAPVAAKHATNAPAKKARAIRKAHATRKLRRSKRAGRKA